MRELPFRLYDGKLMKTIELHSKRLACDPRELVLAIVHIVFHSNLVDSVLDGDHPSNFATALRINHIKLSERQADLLMWIINEFPSQEYVSFSYRIAAQALGWQDRDVRRVVRSLIKAGDISLIEAGKKFKASRYRVAKFHLEAA